MRLTGYINVPSRILIVMRVKGFHTGHLVKFENGPRARGRKAKEKDR